MVEVAGVDGDAEEAAEGEGGAGFDPVGDLLLSDGLYEPCYGHEADGEEEVVGHLYVVGEDLQSHEDACETETEAILAAVAECHAADGGGYEGEGEDFPDMSCCDDDEVVA